MVFFGGAVQVVSTYTPRAGDLYHWVPLTPRRFKSTLAASPAVLPEGSEEITGYLTKGTATHRYTFTIDLDDIPAAAVLFSVESSQPRDTAPDDASNVGLSLAYTPATRTLTYAPRPNATDDPSIPAGNRVALGAVRARGFA